MPDAPNPEVRFELFTSAFCGACNATRAVLGQVAELVPGAVIREHDVAFEPELSEQNAIEATPTVIVLSSDGGEVFRASGVPNVNQVLSAAALALP